MNYRKNLEETYISLPHMQVDVIGQPPVRFACDDVGVMTLKARDWDQIEISKSNCDTYNQGQCSSLLQLQTSESENRRVD